MLAALGLLALAPAATAEPLAPTLDAMLRQARPDERKVLVNVAKRMYPGQIADINKLVDQIQKDEKVTVAKSGFAEGFTGEASLGGYRSTGNTDEWGITGAIAMKRQGPLWVHQADLRLDVKEESGERTEERALGTYSLRRNLTESKWFVLGALRYERDEFQGIARRFGEAIGPGYQLVDTNKIKWDLMAGPDLRQTRFVNEPDTNTFGLYARSHFSWKFTDTLRFTQNSDGVLDGSNNSSAIVSAITSDLYGLFALRLSYTIEYESDPPDGREKLETYTRATLIYDF